jgi:hypothetical protein
MIEAVSAIMTILNAFALNIIRHNRNLLGDLNTARDKISYAFDRQYLEFGRLISGQNIVEEQLISSVNGIRRVNFITHTDIHRLNGLTQTIYFCFTLSILAMICGILTLFAGLQLNTSQLFWGSINRNQMLTIPIYSFFVQIFILCLLFWVEAALKRIISKYESRSY